MIARASYEKDWDDEKKYTHSSYQHKKVHLNNIDVQIYLYIFEMVDRYQIIYIMQNGIIESDINSSKPIHSVWNRIIVATHYFFIKFGRTFSLPNLFFLHSFAIIFSQCSFTFAKKNIILSFHFFLDLLKKYEMFCLQFE